jgi:outer membrane protein
MEFQQIAQQDIQKQEAELMEPVYAKADEAVKKVAAAGGYIVVFNTAGDQPSSAGLAYFDAKALVDITATVKQELGITE